MRRLALSQMEKLKVVQDGKTITAKKNYVGPETWARRNTSSMTVVPLR